MKDWKDKVLEDSFPKKTQEQEIEEAEQKIKGFFKWLLKLVTFLVAIAVIIGLIFFVDIPYPSFSSGILFAVLIATFYGVYNLQKWLKQLDSALFKEIRDLKSQLAPLFYLPLASQAKDLKVLESVVDDENLTRNKFFLRTEISEMEEFAKSHFSSEPFEASDSLKEALREWAHALTNRWKADKLVKKYKQTLMDVSSGKVSVEQAEESLRGISSMPLLWLTRDKDEQEINEWYNQRAEFWQTGKWVKHLETIRNISTLKTES